MIRSAESWIELYEQNEVDFVPYVTNVQAFNKVIHFYSDEHISLPIPATGVLQFDASRPPFDDLLVRQALVLAIDRQGVIGRRAKGVFFPATGGLVPPGILGHVPGIALPYDPDLAREKLADAGYPNGLGFPKVEILMPDVIRFGGIYSRFAEQWQENLGLNISYDFCDFYNFNYLRGKDKYKAWIWGWHADYPDPDSFLRVYLIMNPMNWFHQEYESLIQKARKISDLAQRMALYRQAELILVQEASAVPLSYARDHMLVKPWVSSIPYSGLSGVIIKDTVIEPHD